MDQLAELLHIQRRCANRGDWEGWCRAQRAIDAIVVASGA